MGDCAGGALAGAVAAAGGVGFIGGFVSVRGDEAIEYVRREWAVALATPGVDRDRLGFGLNVGHLDDSPPGTLEALLEELAPRHIYLSFGDCSKYAPAVRRAGATLYSGFGDTAGALAHAAAGVDVVVAQGSDAGGHTSPKASVFALVPQARAALDAAGHEDTLLLAAGGIVDGRGLAAALCLGADAGIMGTAFTAAEESQYTDAQKRAVVQTPCGASGTTLGTFIDEVRGSHPHASGLPGRCVANQSTDLEEAYLTSDADGRAPRELRRATRAR